MKKLIALILTALLVFSSLGAFAGAYSDKDTVRKVQQALNDAGYNCGTPDGVAGKKTYAAIEAYQKDKGIAMTREIDDALLQALGLAEAAVEPAIVPVNDAAYTIINNGSVPQMPTKLVELTGGIPDSLDILRDRYDFDALKAQGETWLASATKMMDSLIETGSAVIPDFLLTAGAEIDVKFEFEDVFFYIEQTGDQKSITLAAPQQTNHEGVFLMDSDGHFNQNNAGDFVIEFYSSGMAKPGYIYRIRRVIYPDGELTEDVEIKNVIYYRYGNDNVYYRISSNISEIFDGISVGGNGKMGVCAGIGGNTWFGNYDESGNLVGIDYGAYQMR